MNQILTNLQNDQKTYIRVLSTAAEENNFNLVLLMAGKLAAIQDLIEDLEDYDV